MRGEYWQGLRGLEIPIYAIRLDVSSDPHPLARKRMKVAPVLGGFRICPLHPTWPGFTFNTLVYAALLWLLIPGPFVLRRFLRRVVRVKRGLCPACAYPMGEAAVCTECGGPLPQRAVV
jgi:hypothetical protein